MTKLYYDPLDGGGWQVPGKQAKGALGMKVPSSPAELAAWLNERKAPFYGPKMNLEMIADPMDAGPPEFRGTVASDRCPACNRTERTAELIAQSGDVDRIADWIMEKTDQRGIERLFEALGARVGELRREARDAA
jgi:hypothetical protein